MPLVAIRRGMAAGSLRFSLGFTGNRFRLAFSPGHTIGRSEPSIQPTIFSMGYETRVEISRNNVRLNSAIVAATVVGVPVQSGSGRRPCDCGARRVSPQWRAVDRGGRFAKHEAGSMRYVLLTLLLMSPLAAQGQTRIDAINTSFRWLGPDDKVVVDRYDDPKVPNVSCYLSRAETGGVKGGLGLAEDPSRFSLACRAVGPITIPPGLAKHEVIAFAQASMFFKSFQIHRSVDAEKNVLVYTVISTKLINGSPFNSISIVPANAP
jgi:CreA protein